MKKIISGGKELFVFHSHNQVLEAWESHPGLNVFSLDYHTDTREAFGNYAYWRADSEVKAGRCEDPESRKRELIDQKVRAYIEGDTSIRSINDNLRHDEHLDFAVRTDMINRAFILAVSSNLSSSNPNVHIADGPWEYRDERLIEYSIPCIPGCPKDVHDEECRRLRADACMEDSILQTAVARAEAFDPFFFRSYILDIDCDYFNTEKSLRPETLNTFGELVRNAALITVALEPECVDICRFEGSSLNSEEILKALTEITGKV